MRLLIAMSAMAQAISIFAAVAAYNVHRLHSKTVWTEDDGKMISVVARAPDGKSFNIFRFDKSFLENGGTVTGIEINKPEPPATAQRS